MKVNARNSTINQGNIDTVDTKSQLNFPLPMHKNIWSLLNKLGVRPMPAHLSQRHKREHVPAGLPTGLPTAQGRILLTFDFKDYFMQFQNANIHQGNGKIFAMGPHGAATVVHLQTRGPNRTSTGTCSESHTANFCVQVLQFFLLLLFWGLEVACLKCSDSKQEH